MSLAGDLTGTCSLHEGPPLPFISLHAQSKVVSGMRGNQKWRNMATMQSQRKSISVDVFTFFYEKYHGRSADGLVGHLIFTQLSIFRKMLKNLSTLVRDSGGSTPPPDAYLLGDVCQRVDWLSLTADNSFKQKLKEIVKKKLI
jgi:hypothetical protein